MWHVAHVGHRVETLGRGDSFGRTPETPASITSTGPALPLLSQILPLVNNPRSGPRGYDEAGGPIVRVVGVIRGPVPGEISPRRSSTGGDTIARGRVEDHGVVPLPPKAGNRGRAPIARTRADLKPLEVSPPEGASVTVSGHPVSV
jgi:hypothetical protein